MMRKKCKGRKTKHNENEQKHEKNVKKWIKTKNTHRIRIQREKWRMDWTQME